MEPFTHGILFMETFPSVAGGIQVLAEVRTDGEILRLLQISVAPSSVEVSHAGYSVLRGIMEQITGAAYAQGFSVVEFEGERITGASVGRIAHATKRAR